MNRRRISRALGCASLLSVPSTVAAQHVDRIVVFGDSYADTGNALRLAGIDPLTTQVYTTGRFSGGSNYVDTLSDTLQIPQFNFAIGGARTNNGNQSAGLPGLTFEVQQFLAGGGTLGFPVVNTALDRSDLVAVSIGGNDARFYQQSGGTVAGAPAAAATAVTSFQQNFDLVMQRGTPTISFLAGDTGRLPEIATNPAGAAVRTAVSNSFNNSVQNVLAGYASRGSIVHYLDLSAILNNVTANPTAYGITNGLVCPTFQPPTPASTTCVINSSGYLFYGDALHLTSQGFAIVARYVARQLAAPLTLQAPSDLGLDTARQWGRTLSSRGDLYGRTGITNDGFHVYAIGDAFSHDIGATDANSPFEVRGFGGTIGAEYGAGNALVGIAGNYSKPRVRFGDSSARINGRSWQVGAYGSIDLAGLFGQAYLGYGNDKHKITRLGVIEDMTARPDGSHIVAGAKGGYLMSLAALRIGPVVALDYARAKVDSYTEAGDPALTLNVGKQSLKSLAGQGGLEVRGDLAGLHAFADLTAEHDFSGDDRLISFAQTSAPIIVNSWDVPRGKDTYGRLAVGGNANLIGSVSLDAFVTTTFGRDDGQEVAGQIGFKAHF